MAKHDRPDIQLIQEHHVAKMRDGHLVKHYLLASYGYYQLSMPPMADTAFDLLCKRLLERYDQINLSDFPQLALITKGDLEAGTCLLPEAKYPGIVRNSAYNFVIGIHTGELLKSLEENLRTPKNSIRIMRRSNSVEQPVAKPELPRTRIFTRRSSTQIVEPTATTVETVPTKKVLRRRV